VILLAMLLGLVVAIVGIARRRGADRRKPTLTHDYSEYRAVYQRWPGQRTRKFK